MGLNEQDYFGTQPDPEKRNIKVVPVSDRNSPSAIKEESLYEEIDETQMVDYTFDEADNCLVEDNEDTPELKPRKMIYEKLPGLRKQQNSFQRMVEPGAQPVNNSFKAKMSNLSKMSAYSNYSIFSNESNESLNVTEEKSSCQTVTESMESPISPGSINFSLKKSQSMLSSSSSSKDSSTGSVIARDKSLQSFTQALIHTEPEEQNSTKKPEENIYEMVDKSMELLDLKEKNTPRSDSINTFQSYDCSSRSSTLSSVNNPVRLPLMGTRVLPPRNSRLVDLELDSGATSAYYSGDELSSLSGYESIDGSLKDKISSSKNNTTNNSSLQNMTSFSNPNYLCPDAKTMIEKKQQKNKFDETPVSQMSRDESHQNFAAALNSPAESLISDYQVGCLFLYSSFLIKSSKLFLEKIAGFSCQTEPWSGGDETQPVIAGRTQVSCSDYFLCQCENEAQTINHPSASQQKTQACILRNCPGDVEKASSTSFCQQSLQWWWMPISSFECW